MRLASLWFSRGLALLSTFAVIACGGASRGTDAAPGPPMPAIAPLPSVLSVWTHDTPQRHRASLLAVSRAPGDPVRVLGQFHEAQPLDLRGTAIEGAEGMMTLFTAEVGPGSAVRSARAIARLEEAFLSAELGTPDGGGLVAGAVAGRVTFTGTELAPLGRNDLLVARLDRDGAPVWARRYGGSQSGVGSVRAAVGPDGRVALAGTFAGQPPWLQGDDPGAFREGFFVMLIGPDGTPLWTRGWCGRASGMTGVSQVAVTDDGGVLVAGVAQPSYASAPCPQEARPVDDALPTGVYVKKYGEDGTAQWRRGGLGVSRTDLGPLLAMGEQGAAALAFTTGFADGAAHPASARVLGLDVQSGRVLWDATVGHMASAITVVPGTGDVLVAGMAWAPELGVTRLGPGGEQLGASRFGGMYRMGGARMTFDSPTELALWGVVSDCYPYEEAGLEAFGPGARCAETNPLYLRRIQVFVGRSQ